MSLKWLPLAESIGVAIPDTIAGVPIPDNGLTNPLGGTGILISSGEPGIKAGATPGTLIRLASFWYEAGTI